MNRLTLSDPSFPVAAAWAWNALPQHVRNAPSLSIFRLELKTVLFRSSFPDAIWQYTVFYLSARRSVLICHHALAAINWFYWHCTALHKHLPQKGTLKIWSTTQKGFFTVNVWTPSIDNTLFHTTALSHGNHPDIHDTLCYSNQQRAIKLFIAFFWS